MTVTSTNYCSIDEAWGDLTGGKKKDNKRRKQPVQDPICDLYESRANTSAYSAENDLVRFANDYYNRSSNGQENNIRETTPKTVKINAAESMYDLSSNNANKSVFEKQFEMKLPPMYDVKEEAEADEEEEVMPPMPKVDMRRQQPMPSTTPQIDTYNNFDNYDESSNYQEMKRHHYTRYSNLQILDLILYVVSGIILIFLLEQFVKIGIHLQH